MSLPTSPLNFSCEAEYSVHEYPLNPVKIQSRVSNPILLHHKVALVPTEGEESAFVVMRKFLKERGQDELSYPSV